MLAPVLNRAAALGPQTFPWWKDWRGKPSAIIASGASLKAEEVQKLRGRVHVMAIKENAYDPKIAPWADVAYGCDFHWWRYRRGLQEFRGLKVGYDPKILGKVPDIALIQIPKTRKRGNDTWANDLLLDEPGVIGAGGNSGFQCLNLDVQFGSNRILLLGFDFRGSHWYGRNRWERANNPDEMAFKRWRQHMDRAAGIIRQIGVDVVNASPSSALTCFRKASVDDALRGWGL